MTAINEILTIYDLLESEKYVEAHSAIKEALSKYPDSAEVLVLQSEIPLRIGKLKKAEKILLDILNRFPDNSRALNNLACAKIFRMQWKEAFNLLRSALRSDPSNKDALENLNFILNHKSVSPSLKAEIENALCTLK